MYTFQVTNFGGNRTDIVKTFGAEFAIFQFKA